MYQKVKHRLVTIYTITTGIILASALIIIYFMNAYQYNKKYQDQYQTLINSITETLKRSNVISSNQLMHYEKENQAFIYIEDNGVDVGYRGSSGSGKLKIFLMDELRDKLGKDGFNLTNHVIMDQEEQSKWYTIHGNGKERYWGCAVKLQRGNSPIMFMVMFSLHAMNASYFRTAILYCAILMIVMCFTYIMSRKLMQKVLLPLNINKQKQDEFIACASYELRSPIAYIKTANSTLHTNCLPYIDEEHRGYLSSFIENTSQECDRMSLLLEEMLELASANNKTWSIQRNLNDLDLFFAETYERILTSCTSKHHYFELQLPEKSFGKAFFDEKRLYQVIQTLVNNSLQYTPENTTITVAATYEKKILQIEVIDHGQGIPDNEKAKVFERYYRQDQARSDNNHFGLGLSISMELMKLQGGTIELLDTKGGGCTFKLYLPLTI